MARSLSRCIRQISVLIVLFIISSCGAIPNIHSKFYSLSVLDVRNNINIQNENYKQIEFQVHGGNLYNGMHVKATKTKAPRNSMCREDLTNYNISEIWTNSTRAQFVLKVPQNIEGNIYLCLPYSVNKFSTISKDMWIHQGENVTLNLCNSPLECNETTRVMLNTLLHHSTKPQIDRNRRDTLKLYVPKIYGFRVDSGDKQAEVEDDGVPQLLANVNYKLRLYGEHFKENMLLTFTDNSGEVGDMCTSFSGAPRKVFLETLNGEILRSIATVSVNLPAPTNSDYFYFCIAEGNNSATVRDTTHGFNHQGSEDWMKFCVKNTLLPQWASIAIICTCLFFSAMFSGLNLGLMALDRTELKILCNTGTPQERKYAKAIQPVRNHGNYLLCSILLGNVFVNSIFTILLDSLTSGLIAVVCSTLLIVIFGEITPQAICSRHGLAVGAKTIYVTKFIMLLTAPLAYPVSKILDLLLGEEIGNVYNRERLKELVKVTTGTNDLDRDEVNIISGALELCKKTVSEVMTRIEDVFMLNYEAVLDFETVSDIMKSGYSRIPVFEDNRNNIVTMLYIKDLAFVDPDDNTPLKTLCQFYQNPCNFVFEDVTLDIMFRIFKEGNKGHMAFVHRVNSEGECDPFYETVGLITLEDVIEELIQSEIMDETDVFTDNRNKRRRHANRPRQDFSIFADKNIKIRVSPQLTLATYQYLSTAIEPFKPESISERVLRRLLKQDEVFFQIKKIKDWRNDKSTIIYQQGKSADYFVLIVEGRVEVTVGQENLIFESGPFTYFGLQALTQNIGIADSSPIAAVSGGSLQSLNMDSMLRYTFMPDYSVRASTEVFYLKIRRQLYLAAKRATLMERSHQPNNSMITPGDQFDDEVEKLLHSLQEDGSIGRGSPEPNRIMSEILHPDDNVLSPNSTSKTASPKSNASPTVVSIQQPTTRGDGVTTPKMIYSKGDNLQISDLLNGEEDKLLSKK